MKTVTTAFQTAQKKPETYPIVHVYYKRRYWNGSNAYIWETNWTQIDNSELIYVDPVVHQLDSQTLNEFKSSNVSLRLANISNQWKEGNTSGKFAADGTSANGYEPYLMKFQVRSGFANVGAADARVGDTYSVGSEELLTLFTGVAVNYNFESESRTVQISIEGLERLLLNGDALQVTTTVTDESIGTGDGTSKYFYAKNSGTAEIVNVKVGSNTLTQGTDYTISGLNDFDSGATITIANPPSSGSAITVTYKYWKHNQTVENLISDLVSEAGITSTDIDTATLGDIQNNITQTSQADFEAGTNNALDTTSEPGSAIAGYFTNDARDLFNNFSSGTFGSNGWSEIGTTPVAVDISGGRMRYGIAASADFIKKSFGYNVSIGVFECQIEISHGDNFFRWWFMAGYDDVNAPDGYGIAWGGSSSAFHTDLRFVRSVVGVGMITLATVSGAMSTGVEYTLKVTRDQDGNFKIYRDGTLIIEAKDTTFTARDRMFYQLEGANGSSKYIYIDDIYVPKSSFSIVHQSQTIDTVSGLDAWGNLSVNLETPTGESLDIQTRTSNDGSSWDSWLAVTSGTGAINSSVKRYIQCKFAWGAVDNGMALEADLYTIKIHQYSVQFTSDRVFMAIGNFAGMTCYQAIQELAKFVDFEWGLDDNETFFFRSRTVSATPDETFTQSTNLLNVLFLRPGYENTYAIVRAQFGEFTSEQVASADVRTSALEIYGRRVFNISSSILINPDTNVADGIAATYFNRLSSKRRRLRIRTKYWPQMELSDTVSVTFNHDAFTTPAVEPFLNALVCKVIGTKHDPESAVSEFELEEIL